MNKHKNLKENNEKTRNLIIGELVTFNLSKNQEKLLNEFRNKEKIKKNLIFMPRVYGKNPFWKASSKDKKNEVED